MTIQLESRTLVKARLRRHSPEDIEEMRVQIDRLLENDVIEDANSPYLSNAHLVPKKNGQKRLVVDFIPLNTIAVKDHYPIPRVEDLFNVFRGAKYFCALDCTEGFHQIKIAEEHRERTAFITPHGMYQYKRVPFGFTNSPAKYQRTINEIFHEGLYKSCVIYIDDLLVFGSNFEETLSNLKWVFRQCKTFNVKLKASKCVFMKRKVEFLGHMVSENSIAPIPGKNDPLFSNVPQNKTDVMSILGSLNYYSRFIDDYTNKTEILRQLTKKDKVFEWSQEHTLVLTSLRSELSQAIPHSIPDSNSDKIVELKISDAAIEAICLTKSRDLISRAGSALSQSEANYTPVENLTFNCFGIR